MTQPATESPPLLPQLLQRLSEAATPLTLKDAAKGLVKTGKKAPPPPDFTALLASEIDAQRVFKYPSGSKGAERYWGRDEKQVIRDAVLAAAITPKKLADLAKVAVSPLKSDKAFASAIVEEMVAAGQLHKQSAANKPLYGKNPPPERNDPAKVRAALHAAATSPQKLANLITVAVKETQADKSFVTMIANDLIAGKQLHEHPPTSGKTPFYGREKPAPTPPLERKEHAKALGKLVTDAARLLATAGVSTEELLQVVRVRLGSAQPVAKSIPPAPEPAMPPPNATASPALTEERLRAGLKAAYDELCLDVEFQDRLVEIRRLYHEAARGLPALTVNQFHHALESLQKSHTVELHSLNEVQHAKEPELAMRRGDRLLYYVLWR